MTKRISFIFLFIKLQARGKRRSRKRERLKGAVGKIILNLTFGLFDGFIISYIYHFELP